MTGPDAALAKRGIGCSEVAEPSRVFERNIRRQLDHRALGRSLELAEPTVRIIVEQHLRIAGEAKIALKNSASAKRDSIRAACAAGAAASERIHVDPFTERDIVNAVANLGDDACCIKTKSRWSRSLRYAWHERKVWTDLASFLRENGGPAGCARQFAAIRKKDRPYIVYRYAGTGRPYLIVDKRAVGAKNVGDWVEPDLPGPIVRP